MRLPSTGRQMLREALGYPQRGAGWLKTVVVGSLLTLVGTVTFVPLIPVQGYLLNVARTTARGERTPPRFEGWGDLFFDGFRAITVQVVYLLAPVLLVLLGVLLGGFGTVGAGGSGASTLGVAVVTLGSLAAVPVALLVPAALARVAVTDSLLAGFDLRTVAAIARQPEYVVAIVPGLGVLLVLGVVGTTLTLILVGAAFTFYGQLVAFHLFGQGYAAATGGGRE